MKAHGGCGCARVHIFTATALGWCRVASPTLGRLYPGRIPRYSFYRRLSGPQGQFGHEGVKKNLHPSDTRDRTRAVQPIAQRLAAWVTWPTLIEYAIEKISHNDIKVRWSPNLFEVNLIFILREIIKTRNHDFQHLQVSLTRDSLLEVVRPN